MDLSDVQLSKLLIKSRWVTPIQLKECRDEVEAMRGQPGAPDLGPLLVAKGYLSADQFLQIGAAHGLRQGRLFGEIAMRWNLITQDDLKAALIQQSEMRIRGEKPRLGAILVNKGLMKAHQVQSILSDQGKRVATCPACNASFNVRIGADHYVCKRCGATIPLGTAPEGSADAHFLADDTLVGVPNVADAPPPAAPASTATPAPIVKIGPGDKLGEYKLHEELGRDHLGMTYRATRANDGKVFAVKVLDEAWVGKTEFITALQQKIGQVAKLSHPNLRRIYSMGQSSKRQYVVLEFIEGDSLRSVISAGSTLSPRKALTIASQLCDALAYVHGQGHIHGDIRPSNILVSREGRVVLGNLGLSEDPAANIRRIAAAGQLAPFYVAPEQVTGRRPVDFRADIYGLGATLYHLLAGRPPFEGTDPGELLLRFTDDEFPPPSRYNPSVPEEVSRVIVKMLAGDPDERHGSLAELVQDLQNPGQLAAEAQSTKMIRMLAESPDLATLARPRQGPRSATVVGLGFAALLVLALAVAFGLEYATSSAARKTAALEFRDVEVEYANNRDRIDKQLPLIARLRTFRDSGPALEAEQLTELGRMVTDVERRHEAARTRVVEETRARVMALARDGQYSQARIEHVRAIEAHPYPDVRARLEGLDAAIVTAENQGFEKIRTAAAAAEAKGDRTGAIEILKRASPPTYEPTSRYVAQAKAEIAAIEERIAQATRAATDDARAASLARAKKAIEDSRADELRHALRTAIRTLREKARPTVDAEHQPLIDARLADLERQLSVFEHLEHTDVSKLDCACTIEGVTYRVDMISEAFILLQPGRKQVDWTHIASADVLAMGLRTLPTATDKPALEVALGAFALRHGLVLEAIELLAPHAAGGVGKAYWEEARAAAVARFAQELDGATASKDARQRLVLALKLEHAFRRPLSHLSDQARALAGTLRAAMGELGGTGTTVHDFDTTSELPAGAEARATHGGGAIGVGKGEVVLAPAAKLPVLFLVLPGGNDAKLELRLGELRVVLQFEADGALRAWTFVGDRTRQIEYALGGARDQWRLVEVRAVAGKVAISIDGLPIDGEPLAAAIAPGPLGVKSLAAPAITIDLVACGK